MKKIIVLAFLLRISLSLSGQVLDTNIYKGQALNASIEILDEEVSLELHNNSDKNLTLSSTLISTLTDDGFSFFCLPRFSLKVMNASDDAQILPASKDEWHSPARYSSRAKFVDPNAEPPTLNILANSTMEIKFPLEDLFHFFRNTELKTRSELVYYIKFKDKFIDKKSKQVFEVDIVARKKIFNPHFLDGTRWCNYENDELVSLIHFKDGTYINVGLNHFGEFVELGDAIKYEASKESGQVLVKSIVSVKSPSLPPFVLNEALRTLTQTWGANKGEIVYFEKGKADSVEFSGYSEF